MSGRFFFSSNGFFYRFIINGPIIEGAILYIVIFSRCSHGIRFNAILSINVSRVLLFAIYGFSSHLRFTLYYPWHLTPPLNSFFLFFLYLRPRFETVKHLGSMDRNKIVGLSKIILRVHDISSLIDL